MLTIIDLPVELLHMVMQDLDTLSRYSLSLTCRFLHLGVGPIRLSRDETRTVLLQREQSDPDRYARVCSKCIRLRQFFHFSLGQASSKTKPAKRICLDCYVSSRYNPKNPVLIRWFLDTTIAVCAKCRTYMQCSDAVDPRPKSGRSINIQRCILPHQCTKNGEMQGDPQASPFLSVDYLRSLLEDLEARLPKRKLLIIRADYPYRRSVRERSNWEDFLIVLCELAKEHTPNEEQSGETVGHDYPSQVAGK